MYQHAGTAGQLVHVQPRSSAAMCKLPSSTAFTVAPAPGACGRVGLLLIPGKRNRSVALSNIFRFSSRRVDG